MVECTTNQAWMTTQGSTLPVDSRSPNHQTTVLGSSSRSADIMSITSWSAAGPTLVCWTLESYRQLGRLVIWCIESYKQLRMNDHGFEMMMIATKPQFRAVRLSYKTSGHCTVVGRILLCPFPAWLNPGNGYTRILGLISIYAFFKKN